MQAERLAAIGEMAVALRARIRNPVAGTGSSPSSRDDLEDRLQIASTMTDIIAESDRLDQRALDARHRAPLEVKVRADDLAAFSRRLVDEFRTRAPGPTAVDLVVDDGAGASRARALRRAHARRECIETVVRTR